MIRSIIAGIICCFIVLFFTGWIFEHYIAPDYFSYQSSYSYFFTNQFNDVSFFLLGLLFQSIALSSIYYVCHSKKDSNIISGLRFGLLIGVFVSFGMGFIMYGSGEIVMRVSDAFLYAVWKIIHYAIAGVTLGLALDVTESERVYVSEESDLPE